MRRNLINHNTDLIYGDSEISLMVRQKYFESGFGGGDTLRLRNKMEDCDVDK